MSAAKVLLAISIALLTSLSGRSQCAEPQGVVLILDYVAQSYGVTWSYTPNPDCPALYFEVEYSNNTFTPGMGEGTLISPVYDWVVEVPEWTTHAWVRAVCDCLGSGGEPGEGDGIPDTNSGWIEATLYIPIYPDPSFECGVVNVTVASPVQCGSFPQEINFIALFSDFPEVTPSCLTEPQYMLWTSFTAPTTGAVSVTMSTSDWGGGELWNDFGLIVLDQCFGEEIFCHSSYTEDDEVIVSGLTPGENYVIGNWNNGYPYEWYQDEFGTWYNGTTNIINVCETSDEGDDWTITPGPLVTIECSELEPQPEYTLGASWGNDAVINSELIINDFCGDTSYFLITVMDDMGHFASAEQQVIITDTTAPEILLEEEITISCGEVPAPDYEVVDNCAAVEVLVEELIVEICPDSYDVLYTIAASDICGNESSASQVISVVDNIAPQFGNCPDSIFFNTDMSTIDMLDLSGNSNFEISDNCSEDIQFEQSIPMGTTLEVGYYPIEFSITDNCLNVGTCESIVVVTSTVGLDEYSVYSLALYPNPVKNEFTLLLNDELRDAMALEVYDLSGRSISIRSLSGLDGDNVSIDVNTLSAGSYLVVLIDFQGRALGRTRMIKE